MTAPGNSALLITLLAVFVACCAYAAGRLHQRYQMERDREEAYRDGYDTATRSVFSLAARVIAPRRSARGAAAAPVIEGAASSLSASSLSASASSAMSSSAMSPSALPVPAVSAEDGAVRPATGYSGLLRRSAVPGVTVVPGATAASGSGAAEGNGSLGFPVPPPPPPRVVAEPAAVGGVVYRQLRDPHIPVDETANPDGRHTVPDELVQGSTYRLPADRVFRAKVRDATLPDEPTTRISVPKPRQS